MEYVHPLQDLRHSISKVTLLVKLLLFFLPSLFSGLPAGDIQIFLSSTDTPSFHYDEQVSIHRYQHCLGCGDSSAKTLICFQADQKSWSGYCDEHTAVVVLFSIPFFPEWLGFTQSFPRVLLPAGSGLQCADLQSSRQPGEAWGCLQNHRGQC